MEADMKQIIPEEPKTLTKQNKDDLLGKHYQDVLNGQPQAITVLERLRQLNKDVWDLCGLKTSALDKFKFKLVVTDESISHIPSYLVVSHCWHKPEWSSIDPEVVSSWEISKGMACAILELRESSQEGVWIDRICIDQSKDTEKMVAIGCMDLVYKAARRLVILLEDVHLSEEEEREGLKYAQLYKEVANPNARETIFTETQRRFNPSDEEYNTFLEFLRKITSARWVERAWCSHEIRVQEVDGKRNALFLVFGSKRQVLQFEFRVISFFMQYLIAWDQRRSQLLPDRPRLRGPGEPGTWSFVDLHYRFNKLLWGGRSTLTPLVTQLHETFECGCEKDVDRIAIALNVRGVSLYFGGSVESADECYWIMTALSLAEGDCTPLKLTGAKIRNALPKGALSWAQKPRNGPLKAEIPALLYSTVRTVNPDFIELDLFIFKHVPQRPSERSLQETDRIIEISSIKPHAPPTWAVRRDPLEQPGSQRGPQEQFRDLVACSIDNGIGFVRNFASTVQAREYYMDEHFGPLPSPDATHETASLELLKLFGITDDKVQNFREEYLDPVVQFFIRITHPLFYLMFTKPCWINTFNGHKALVDNTWASFWFAMPVALAGSSFDDPRIWLIEPYKPGDDRIYAIEDGSDLAKRLGLDGKSDKGYEEDKGQSPPGALVRGRCERFDKGDDREFPYAGTSWRLMAKAAMLGIPPIQADGDSVELRQAQKVFG